VLAVGERRSGRHLAPALLRLPRGGGAAAVVRGVSDSLETSVSPDGATVAETLDHGLATGLGGVVVRDVATRAVRLTLPQRATGDELYEQMPLVCWSADGSRVSVLSQERRLGRWTLRVADVRAGRLIRTIRLGRIGTVGCFSADGRRQLLVRRTRRATELSVVDLDTGAARLVRAHGREQASWAVWSPDGRTVALTSGGEVALIDLETGWGPAYPLTNGEAEELTSDLLWAPDGSALAYAVENVEDGFGDASALVVMPTSPPAPPRVLVQSAKASIGPIAWAPDGRSIAFATLRFPEFEDHAQGLAVVP
jgi:Tol biopolymer transport system component